jgi:hypothetical protein
MSGSLLPTRGRSGYIIQLTLSRISIWARPPGGPGNSMKNKSHLNRKLIELFPFLLGNLSFNIFLSVCDASYP